MRKLAWLAVYALAVALPIIVVSLTGPEGDDDPFLLEAGNTCALIALGILLMQPVLASRPRHPERAFGLDAIYRFHRFVGVTAGVLLLLHPLLLAASNKSLLLITSFQLPWFILLAKAGLGVVTALVVTSLFRGALRLRFEAWRALHNALAVPLVAIGLIHSGLVGGPDRVFGRPAALAAWVAFGLVAVSVWLWHRVVRPVRLKARSWTVVEVKKESHNVWTVKLEPPVGADVPDYLPGQFHFLTLYRHKGPRPEEHPFTISSSPTEKRFVTSTIKASGDFTATIGESTCGSDAAARQGAFGRFSSALHPEEKDLVFIAGGIGVTPFISMLRWMRDVKWDGGVTLLWSNRAERDILFRDELDALVRDGVPALKVVHVLSEPDASWQGAKGRIDEAILKPFVDAEAAGKVFYVCGPPGMIKSISAALRSLGVSRRRIRSERFAL